MIGRVSRDIKQSLGTCLAPPYFQLSCFIGRRIDRARGVSWQLATGSADVEIGKGVFGKGVIIEVEQVLLKLSVNRPSLVSTGEAPAYSMYFLRMASQPQNPGEL